MKIKAILVLTLSAAAASVLGADVTINEVDATGNIVKMGTVTLSETPYGILLTPDLKGLPAGMHGFHLHEKPNCANTTVDNVVTVAGGAGGHWDPEHTAKHEGPYGQGHLGDLPGLYAAPDGSASTPVLAPRIKTLNQLHGLALMIHAGGDNHSDHPVKFGGGGARIACGVVD